jgi:hypothetical protein
LSESNQGSRVKLCGREVKRPNVGINTFFAIFKLNLGVMRETNLAREKILGSVIQSMKTQGKEREERWLLS